MNFYTLEFEDQVIDDLREQEEMQVNEEQIILYEQSSNKDLFKNYTFDGYFEEEPFLIFDYIEEVQQKQQKSIVKKSKKIKKSDTETDVQFRRKSKNLKLSNDVAQLQQCQILKTIISQMEAMLQQTKKNILDQYLKKRNQE